MSLPAVAPLPCNANFARLLWCSSREWDARTALEERERRVSYAELRARAAAVAARVRGSGVAPGDRVAIFLERGSDAAATYFGVLAAGCAAILVNDALRPRQVEYVLRHAGARLLLTRDRLLARQPRALETATEILDVGGIAAAGEFEPDARLEGDLAQIIYTSGSTGMPKGVAFGHRALWADVYTVLDYLDLQPSDRTISLLPFSGVYGLNQLICNLASGGTLVIEGSPLPQEIARSIRERNISVVAAVPPLWSSLLGVADFTQAPIESLRVLQNAGGHLPVPLVQRLREAQPQARLFLQYGMTEVFRSTFLPPADVDERPESMGKAVPGAEVMVLREDSTLCEVDEVGELVHRGPTAALGYWDDPEKTDSVFRPNPLRAPGTPAAERVVYSGDMVRRDAEGYLHFVSRRDRLIKTLGYRVGPDEIADVLFASGEIAEVAITTEPDERRGDRIVAHVVLTADGSLERLRTYARAELPPHMQPATYVARDSIPRLVSGKYDIETLRAGAGTPVTDAAAGEKPSASAGGASGSGASAALAPQ